MLRGIVSRALAGRRRTTGMAGPTARPRTGPPAAGGTANQEIERGARSVLRGVSRKKRGL